MATIILTVPNDKALRFLTAINYQATIPDGNGGTMPNPVTGAQAAKAWILQNVKDQILRYEANTAAQNSMATALVQDLSDIT